MKKIHDFTLLAWFLFIFPLRLHRFLSSRLGAAISASVDKKMPYPYSGLYFHCVKSFWFHFFLK